MSVLALVLAAGETRDTFANLETWELVLWYALIVVSTAIFLWGLSLLVGKYRK